MNKDQFRLLQPNEKQAVLASMDKAQKKAFIANPDLFLYPKQVIEGDHRYILFRGGRRAGKSWACGAFMAKKVYQGYKVMGLCGPTYDDVSKIMVPAIQRWFYGKNKPEYVVGRKTLEFSPESDFPGVQIHCFTSDKEIRGYSLQALWCDEIATWLGNADQIKENFTLLDTCVSEGPNPQTIISGTPKPIKLLFEMQEKIDLGDKRYKLITCSMLDNPFLPDEYKQNELKKYTGRQRLQEVMGELLNGIEGALFQKQDVKNAHVLPKDYKEQDLISKCVSVDPAVTSTRTSDETGIHVIGKDDKDRCFVLDDQSGRWSPKEWARLVNDAFVSYQCDSIVVEGNQGYDLVKSNLVVSYPHLEPYIKIVIAKKSKSLRAEPVANILEMKRIFFTKDFPELERQLVEYTGNDSKSPDRMDSFVYGVTELLIKDQDLFVFKNLRASANLSNEPKATLTYSLGLHLTPYSSAWVLTAFNKLSNQLHDHHYYILDFGMNHSHFSETVLEIKNIMKTKSPIYITCNPEYEAHFRKNQIPAKATQIMKGASQALIDSMNSDIMNDQVMVYPGRYDAFKRLLKNFQYDGDTHGKTGNFVLMQDDTFLKALLNAYSASHHFGHKAADLLKMTPGERMLKEIYDDLKTHRIDEGDEWNN